LEDVLADVVVIALAGNFFDDDAEEQEAIVAVVPLRAGLEFERAALVEVDVVLEGAEVEAVLVEFRPEDIAGASGVGEEVVDGDLGSKIFCWRNQDGIWPTRARKPSSSST
jgi:hypothetical protein